MFFLFFLVNKEIQSDLAHSLGIGNLKYKPNKNFRI